MGLGWEEGVGDGQGLSEGVSDVWRGFAVMCGVTGVLF